MSHRTHLTVNSALRAFFKRGSQVGLGLGAMAPVLALANPTGGQMVSGTATITTPSSNGMVIKQSSASAIIDWQQFNIGIGQYVQFLQPSSSSVVLNRVIGGGSSSILGSLTGNGQIFLVNTNGVYFGKGASVDAQGFLASTLDINNSDFLSGHYLFNKTGSDAQIVNQGNITAHKGGYVVLAGDYAENDGIIAAQSGHIVLASGTKSTLTLNGNSFVSYAVNQATLSQLAGVSNAGDLEANGGTVIMTADVANLLKATVVNNTGLIEAHGISKQGGVIQLTATGGNIVNAGLLDASATTLGQQGGDITLKTDGKTSLTSKSRIIDTGDGANGGSVEVSGNTVALRGSMLIGKGGKLLLDPNSIEIVANSTSTAGTAGTHGGTGSGSGFTKLGTGFIQTQLNHGVGVDISAHAMISASANVHAITATGGAGILTLKTARGGVIALGGVDINIAGNLAVTGTSGLMVFGHLTANSISLHDSHGTIYLPKATLTKGAVSTWSAKTTGGNLSIDAAYLHMDSSSANATLALSAKQQLGLQASYIGVGAFPGQFAPAKGNLVLAGASMLVRPNMWVGGKLTATASDGNADFSGGYADISNVRVDGGIKVSVSGGNLTAVGGFQDGVAGSGISLKDTGGSVSVAGSLDAQGGDINVTDVGSGHKVILKGKVTASLGSVNVNAGAQDVSFGGSLVLGSHGVNLTARDIVYTGAGSFQVNGGTGALSIKGRFSPPGSTEGAFSHDLQLIAGKGIKLDHNLVVNGTLEISGASLAYTGTDSDFDMQANGSLVLAATIGGAKAPVNYGVGITLNQGEVQLTRSIYTKSQITVDEAGRAGVASSATTGAGIYVGNLDGTPITLSAKGGISLEGARVAVGYVGHGSSGLHPGAAPITITTDDGNAKTSTDTLILHASDTTVGFGVFLGAGTGSFGTNAGGKLTSNRAVTLHAGADIEITGRDVELSGGGFSVFADNGGGSVSLNDRLTLSAGRDVGLVASHAVVIAGGADRGGISADGGTKENISITGGVSISAGRDVIASGSTLAIHGGRVYGFASVSSHVSKPNKATVAITSGVSLTAGRNLDLTAAAHDLTITGGTSVGTGSGASAKAAGAVVNVGLHGDVSLTAGDAANLKAKHEITLHAGSHVGAAFQQHFSAGTGASNTHTAFGLERIFAEGKGATATVTDTANLTISTGKGGFSASAQTNGVTIHGGSGAGAGASIKATATGAKAGLTAQATVSITDKGSFTLKGAGVAVHGGSGAARLGFSSQAGIGSSAFSNFQPVRLTGIGGANMGYSVASAVTITAAGAVNVTALGGELNLRAGSQHSQGLQVHIDSTGAKGATQVNIDSSLSLTGGSTVTLKAATVLLRASGGALSGAALTAQAGTLTVTDKAALHIAAGKGLVASASSGVLQVFGGSAANQALLQADNGAKVKATVDASLSLASTKGDMTLQGKSLFVEGSTAGHAARVLGEKGGSAALVMDTGVDLKTAGHLDLNGSVSTLAIQAGRAATQGSFSSAQVTAQQGKAKAGFSADTAVTVSAGSVSLEGHQIHIFGGSSLARVAGVHASSAATANLQVDGAVVFKTAGVFTASANTSVNILGGPGLMGGSGHVTATGGGVTTVGIDGSVSITAGSMSLHGGHAVLVRGGSSAGHAIAVGAGAHGKLTDTTKDGVSLIAAKHLTLTAVTGSVRVLGGLHAGSGVSVHAGAGAAASYSVDASVLLKGGDIAIHGGSSGGASIGNQLGVGKGMNITGSSGGKAAFTVHGGVTLAAVNSITVDHPVNSDSGGIKIGNPALLGSIGSQGLVKGHGGSAKALVDASTLLQVTGAKGTITLDDSRGDVQLVTNSGVARSDQISADFGGAASLDVQAEVGLSAKSAVSIVGRDVLAETGLFTGVHQHVAGNGAGAKVTVTTDASLKLNAGKLDVHTSQDTLGNAIFAVNQGAGSGGSDRASNGAVVTSNTDADIGIAVTGKLSIAAPHLISLNGGNSADDSVTADAFFGGKLTRSVNAGVNVSAASASFSQGHVLSLEGGGFIANHQVLDATGGASVKLTTQAGVLLHTTHAFTDHGLGAEFFSQRAGSFDRFSASGAKSLITAVEQSMVNITAGGAVILSLSGNAVFNAISGDGEDAHSAPGAGGAVNLSADTHVGVSAGGALSITAGTLDVVGGGHVGASSSVIAEGGKFTASVQDDVSLAAKGNLTLHTVNGGAMDILTHTGDADSASYNVFQGGAVKITQDDGVHLQAGGALALTLDGSAAQLTVTTGGILSVPGLFINGNGTAVVNIDAGISILGKSVHTTDAGPAAIISSGVGFSGSGLTYKTGITVTGGTGKLNAPAPLSLGTLQRGGLILNLETVLAAPAGAQQPTLFTPAAGLQTGSPGCDATLVKQDGHCLVKD